MTGIIVDDISDLPDIIFRIGFATKCLIQILNEKPITANCCCHLPTLLACIPGNQNGQNSRYKICKKPAYSNFV